MSKVHRIFLTFNLSNFWEAYNGFSDGKYNINFDIGDYEVTKANIRALAIHEAYGHGIMGYRDIKKNHHLAYFATISSPYWQTTTERFKIHNVDVMWKLYYYEVGHQRMPDPYQSAYDKFHSR